MRVERSTTVQLLLERTADYRSEQDRLKRAVLERIRFSHRLSSGDIWKDWGPRQETVAWSLYLLDKEGRNFQYSSLNDLLEVTSLHKVDSEELLKEPRSAFVGSVASVIATLAILGSKTAREIPVTELPNIRKFYRGMETRLWWRRLPPYERVLAGLRDTCILTTV